MVRNTPASIKVTRKDLVVVGSGDDACIKNVQYVASYNWIEAPTATIAVPGCPSAWSPPRPSRKLRKDSGWLFVAQNAARYPQCPLEPLFRALHIEQPKFDLDGINLISDRNNIRKLLYFVDTEHSQGDRASFTIKTQLVGQTVVLNRDETNIKEFVGPQDFRGFGHEFEKSYTREEVPQSTGHHRIISYDFQGLKMMVRSRTDGYVPETTNNDDLESLLGNLDLNSSETSAATTSKFDCHKPPGSALTSKSAGRRVHSSSILEIKTRSENNKFQWSEHAAQQYLSQTPNLVMAYHRYGVFAVPKVESVAAKLEAWEDLNQ